MGRRSAEEIRKIIATEPGADLTPPIIDIHIHIQPLHMFKPEPLALIKKGRKDYADVEKYSADPKAFLGFLDSLGVERAGLINYVAPELMGFPPAVNDWIAEYCSIAPDRLLGFGSVHPKFVADAGAEVDRLARLGIRGLKVHPSHQVYSPNAYREGLGPLALVYERAQAHGMPVMIHTGTSIFPGARNLHAHPMLTDDVSIDYPDLVVILAHGGRPLWMNEAFFLCGGTKTCTWIFPEFRRKNFWNIFRASRISPIKFCGVRTGPAPACRKFAAT